MTMDDVTADEIAAVVEPLPAADEVVYAVCAVSRLERLIEAMHLVLEAVAVNTDIYGLWGTLLPLVEYMPLHRPTSNSEVTPIKSVSQFEMWVIDHMKLLKVDFLGLATLTIMQHACNLIRDRHGVDLNLDNIPLDDPDTFKFLGEGHTAGVFQVEGTGMTRYLVQMQPKNLSHIIAMVALFRPGPMQFIPSYIKRMHGEEEVSYLHPALEPIFKETYGTPIYQEQIIFAAMDLAGYSASEADNLRRAISKKKESEIDAHRIKFIAGAEQKGIEPGVAKNIFDDWQGFAHYGFNKSHAANYGTIAVQTAYLKTHYPVEYMTATLSAAKTDNEKVAFYVADSRSMGIEVLPPDVNHSSWDFSIEDRPGKSPAIRFGLGAIKNVGSNPVQMILDEQRVAKFTDLNDLARRVPLHKVGKRALESMTKAGAMDIFGSRSALLESLDRIISVSTSHFKAIESGQMSFFGQASGIEDDIVLAPGEPIEVRELLEWERELIGLYVSDHPLNAYIPTLKNIVTHYASQLKETSNKDKVVVGGMISTIRSHQTKSNKTMGFATLDDLAGKIELVIFPKAWAQFGKLVQMDAVLKAYGLFRADRDAMTATRAALRFDADMGTGDEPEVGDVGLGAPVGARGHGEAELVMVADGLHAGGEEGAPAGAGHDGAYFFGNIPADDCVGASGRAAADLETVRGESVGGGHAVVDAPGVGDQRVGDHGAGGVGDVEVEQLRRDQPLAHEVRRVPVPPRRLVARHRPEDHVALRRGSARS